MRLRIYSQTPDGEREATEIDVPGDIIRICDDHGRIVESQPWPKHEGTTEWTGYYQRFPTRQPLTHA